MPQDHRVSALPLRDRLSHHILPGKLGTRLRKAESAVFDALCRLLRPERLTPGEFGLLLILHENPGLNQSDLAREIELDRSSVVTLIDRFEQRGLLERIASPLDRRTNALFLTASGQTLLDRLIPKVMEQERQVIARLSGQEQAQLLELLARIA